MENAQLLDYAVAQFQQGKYDDALEAFILAYGRGYEQEWIIQNIYSCYMWGNDEIFRATYERQMAESEIAYEDCILDFIPYRDGEYQIFDKEIGIFRGVFSIHELENIEIQETLQRAEYSAAALVMDWNWRERLNVLAAAKERRLYVISGDMRRICSFFKLPELEAYMGNVKVFSDLQQFQDYFHENTSVYLPYAVLGKQEEKAALLEVIEKEHQYRLTPEGRNTENVLLTIGIPTHDRGNLVLKRLENLLSMPYDAEIEIAISKNGMNLYQKEYEEVSRISDARINYYDHGKELKYNVNWAYVMEMAHGKYVLMVSDEDDVIIGALEHYLKILSEYSDLSLVRAKTKFQYCDMEERLYGKKGLEAFRYEFTRQNYLSGLIIRREDFLQENMLKLQKYSDNPYYQFYPHEWWCAILSQRGDYMQEPFLLIDEQECVAGEEARLAMPEEDVDFWGAEYVPDFATYKERLRQFKGQIEFLHLLCGEDKEMIEIGVQIAIGKAASLFELARERNYDCENYLNMLDQYVSHCIEAVEEFDLDNEQKKRLLIWTENCCVDMYNLHVELNVEKENV